MSIVSRYRGAVEYDTDSSVHMVIDGIYVFTVQDVLITPPNAHAQHTTASVTGCNPICISCVFCLRGTRSKHQVKIINIRLLIS